MTAKRIEDDISDLKISRQRRWQLRHPAKHKQNQQKWEQSEKGKQSRKKYYERKKTDKEE